MRGTQKVFTLVARGEDWAEHEVSSGVDGDGELLGSPSPQGGSSSGTQPLLPHLLSSSRSSETLELTKDAAEEDAWWSEEAALAIMAALSPSLGLCPPSWVKRYWRVRDPTLGGVNLCASYSSASRSGVTVWVGP